MKHLFSAFLLLLSSWIVYPSQGQNSPYDLVIYGGTSGGVAAAIQISRMGKSVILIEPSNHLGGLTTGGLGATDIGNKKVIGGISKEFYKNIKAYYDNPETWKYEDRADYLSRPDQTRSVEGEDAMWTFEPSVAMIVYKKMLADQDIKVVIGKQLNRESGVISKNNRITSITMESGETYTGKMFMDATYEGDLMAASGVSYTTGREANSQYGETLNGVQANFYNLTLKGNVSRNAIHHNFVPGVDPYVVKGDPSSGLLPFIIEGGPGLDGTADKGIQAYCFRMTLTNQPENRIPFEKPANYNELEFELLFRNYEAANGPIEKMYHYGDPLVPWINTPMPNKKTDTNNQKGFSTDFIGQNFDYPEASYANREAFSQKQLEYQQGLMWSLAYHPRIPKKVRDVVAEWGMPKDEFMDRNGWTPQLYVREARRMVSDYVVTQQDCEGLVPRVNDAVGMGSYGMDSHMVQRYVDHNGYVQNEGNFEARGLTAYPISYRSIVPKKGEKENLLVPVCISATRVAFGSARMEPVFMVMGQSAATAASLAIDQNVAVQDLDYKLLGEILLKDGQILDYEK